MCGEGIAIVFITTSMLLGGGLGYAVVADYNAAQDQKGGAAAGTPITTDVGPSAQPSAATTGGGGAGTSAPVNAAKPGQVALATSQAASGVSHDQIVVGGIYDMTGPVDSSVERDTVRAYFNKVNAAGEVHGRKLVLTYCDSHDDTVQTHQRSNEMVSSHVLGVVGWTAPKGENDEVKFLAQQEQIPIIGGLGTPEEFNYPLSYPVSTSFTRAGPGLADELNLNGLKHPSIVYINDVPWIQPVLQAILTALHPKAIHEPPAEPPPPTYHASPPPLTNP